MKTQDIFIAHPKTNEQVSALRAFMKALKIKFEVSENQNYNSDFVAEIKESRIQANEGNVTRVEKENFKSFLGL
jgi:hypothetical protein